MKKAILNRSCVVIRRLFPKIKLSAIGSYGCVLLIIFLSTFTVGCYNDNIDRVIGGEAIENNQDLTNGVRSYGAQLNDAYGLAQTVVKTLGGAEALINKKDVQFEFIREHIRTGKKDISIEKFIFKEGYSSGTYYVHNWEVFPNINQSIHQELMDNEANLFFTDEQILDQRYLLSAKETRHSNLYNFTLLFRLNEDQFLLENWGRRKVNAISYNLIKMSYKPTLVTNDPTVYIFYINPRTNLVDQYLYSIQKIGISEPNILVQLKYDTVENILIPVIKELYHSDKFGKPVGEMFEMQTLLNIQFDNGFGPGD